LNRTQFHKNFKLQKKSFKSSKELIDFSKKISKEVAIFLQQWFNDSLFIEVNTSGSTGKPKVIQLQKKYMINSALATGNYFNLPKNTTALLCMSPNFIAGKMMLVRALTLGWHIDVVEPTLNPLKNSKKQYDFSAMVPLQLNNSIEDIHKIKTIIVGGGAVSNELIARIQNIETAIFTTYGMTETITHIAVKKLNHCNSNFVEEYNYRVLPNVSISKDSRSCLVIKASKVSNEVVVTNDLVELVSSTEFKWLGRFDTVVNSGGIKLIPEQIEKKLAKIILQRFFVTGIPDNLLGKKLILVIEGENTLGKDTFLSKVRNLQSLTKYEIPKEIYLIGKFVETETRKINRKQTLKSLKNIY